MLARRLLYFTLVIILLSPLAYYATGIGQRGLSLSDEPIVQADGRLQSSPRAEALHSLSLPIRIELLLIYPILLFLLQYSGWAVRLRNWLTVHWVKPLADHAWFERLDQRLRRLTRERLSLVDLVEILLYVGLVTIFLSAILWPFAFYRGFILRHQFDLSTQTFSAWLRDFLVSEGLNLVMSLVVFGGFYGLIKLMPRRWPVWLGAGYAILYFAYILLEPIVVTPLFYQITPVTDADLRTRILTMANRAGVIIDDISIIDASSKTTTINAYFTGYGDASKIMLWDTLLQKHPPAEVDVVIAHEMGHWVYHHVLLGSMIAIALTWLGLFVVRSWFGRVWKILGWRGPDDVASFPYLLAMIALAGVLSLPLANGVSRLGENAADQFAIAVSQEPLAAVHLFERFAKENLSMVEVSPWEKFVFYTHPPLSERIERARQALGQ
jgi:Zn-dependent protease with chaperone function